MQERTDLKNTSSLMKKIKKPLFKTIENPKGDIHIQQKVESNRSIKSNTQPVSDLRDNYLYENAYQQTTKMGGGNYQTTDTYRFNPQSTSNEGLGTDAVKKEDKINRFVMKSSSGIHDDRQGSKIYKSKRGQRQSLKKDYFQLQLSQNPEMSRKKAFKDTKKFIKEEVRSRQRSKFFKEKTKNTFTNQRILGEKEKMNLGFMDKPSLHGGDSSMYTGKQFEQKLSTTGRRKMMSIESSYKDKFGDMTRSEAKKSTKQTWDKAAKQSAKDYGFKTKREFKVYIKENPDHGLDRALKQNIKRGIRLNKNEKTYIK